jgi:dihydroflavonol-4-reductase
LQKIGLTGATGHLGRITFEKLKEQGIPCKVLLRKELSEFAKTDSVIGDLSKDDSLNDFVKGCTAVIHSAGMVWPTNRSNPEVIKTNFDGTKRLFDQCRKNQVQHFVYVSSIHSMVNLIDAKVFDETAPLTKDSSKAYDFSKAEVERFLSRQDGMKITIINPTSIIGPGDKTLRAMNQLFYLIFSDKLPVLTSGGFHVVDVRTVADALINSILLNKTGKYLVAGDYYSIKELAMLYGKVNSIQTSRVVMPAGLMRMVSFLLTPIEYLVKKPFPLNSYAVETLLTAHPNISSERSLKDLELTPIQIEQTLKDLHSWFKRELNDE